MAWRTGCLVKKEEGLGRPGEDESVMVTVVMLVWFCGGGEEEERWRNGGGGGGGGEDEAPCAMLMSREGRRDPEKTRPTIARGRGGRKGPGNRRQRQQRRQRSSTSAPSISTKVSIHPNHTTQDVQSAVQSILPGARCQISRIGKPLYRQIVPDLAKDVGSATRWFATV